MKPEDIPLGYYTHINFAFASIDPSSFTIAPMASDVAALYGGVTGLKSSQPGLQVWISIGGWAFNDPGPTRSTFSDLVGSSSAQEAFFSSLISFMSHNGFDGVDLDWQVSPIPWQDIVFCSRYPGNIPLRLSALASQRTIRITCRSSRPSDRRWMEVARNSVFQSQ